MGYVMKITDISEWISRMEFLIGQRSRQSICSLEQYIIDGYEKDLEKYYKQQEESVIMMWRLNKIRKLYQSYQNELTNEQEIEFLKIKESNPIWDQVSKQRANLTLHGGNFLHI